MVEEENKYELLPGTVIAGKYRLERLIAKGGFGYVFEAVNVLVQIRVALKILILQVLNITAEAEPRFWQEARLVNQIGHENIVKAYDIGRDGPNRYVAMEYLEGVTLQEELEKHGKLDPFRVIHIAKQIASALLATHSKGIIHRDLKPSNIFLTTIAGDPDFVKVLDFGIAKSTIHTDDNELRTKTGMLLGTPQAMSPEQWRDSASIDQRSDIYALGINLFKMLTDRYPFQGDQYALMVAHREAPPPKISDVNPALRNKLGFVLDQIIHRMLAKDPSNRYQTMAEVYEALHEIPVKKSESRKDHKKKKAVKAPVESSVPPLEAKGSPLPNTPVLSELDASKVPRDNVVTSNGKVGVLSSTRSFIGEVSRTYSFRSVTRTLWIGLVALASVGTLCGIAYVGVWTLRTANHVATPSPAQAVTAEAKSNIVLKRDEKFRAFIDLTPADTQLFVDGSLKTGTPPIILDADPGHKFRVEAKHDGYQSITEDVVIENTDRRVSLRLSPLLKRVENPAEQKKIPARQERATLTISVTPWAFVSIDGSHKEETPFVKKVAPGSHTIVVENPALNRHEKIRLNLKSGETKPIRFNWSE